MLLKAYKILTNELFEAEMALNTGNIHLEPEKNIFFEL